MFLVQVFSILVLGGLIWFFHKQDDSAFKRFFFPILFYKLAAGVCMGLLYTYYYTEGDTFSFFRDAMRLSEAAREDPTGYLCFLWGGGKEHPLWQVVDNHQSRSLFMVKWVSVVSLVSGDNYWIATLYFSFFSFAGAWYLVRVIAGAWPHAEVPALVAFLVYPSIAVWSSGIMKESLALPALFCMTAVLLKWWTTSRIGWMDGVVLLFSVWIGWRLKYYYTGIFLSVAGASLAVKYMTAILRISRVRSQLLLWVVTFVLFTATATLLHPNFNPQVLPQVIADNYQAYAEKSDEGGMIIFGDLNTSWWSMIRHAPEALASGLFRPFLWEADSWIMLAGALENTVLLILFLWAMIRYLRAPSVREPILVLALFVFVILLGILLPLSTPNFGTLSRYRIGYLAFFAFLVLSALPVKVLPQRRGEHGDAQRILFGLRPGRTERL